MFKSGKNIELQTNGDFYCSRWYLKLECFASVASIQLHSYSRTHVCASTIGLCDGQSAKWVGARGNQTFVILDEMLIPESTISQYKAFANSEMIGKYCIQCTYIIILCTQHKFCIGIVPPKVSGEDSHTILVERSAKADKGEQLKARR